MANMSYCRFENTSRDLRDCVNALEDIAYEGISKREWHYAKTIRNLCEEYLEAFDDINEDEIELDD